MSLALLLEVFVAKCSYTQLLNNQNFIGNKDCSLFNFVLSPTFNLLEWSKTERVDVLNDHVKQHS